MVAVRALRRWLVVAALLRCLSVYIGFFNPSTFKTTLFDLRPEYVNDLYGRTFATWTLTTSVLCLICARNPCIPSIYGATLFSFVFAFMHFASELALFGTLSWKKALAPMLVAGISIVWMGAGWNYYTKSSFVPESSAVSEDAELDSAALKKE